jgi:hypothetical protein
MRFFLLVVSLVSLLSGCGTGGGDSGGGSVKTLNLVGNSEIRDFTPGDYIEYTGTYEFNRYGYTTSQASGIIEQTQSSNGNSIISSTSIKITHDSTVGGALQQETDQSIYYNYSDGQYLMFEQGGDQNFYAVNELKGLKLPLRTIIEDGSYGTIYSKGSCDSYTSSVCSNSNIIALVNITYTLIGTETVSTEIGNFETYNIKVISNQTSNNTDIYSNNAISGNLWIFPPIGTVKQTYTHQSKDLSPVLVTEGTWILKSTNIKSYSRKNGSSNSTLPFFNPIFNIPGISY